MIKNLFMKKIPTRGSTVSVGIEALSSFPLNGGSEGLDFSVPLNSNGRLFFSHIQFYYFGRVLCFTIGDVQYITTEVTSDVS